MRIAIVAGETSGDILGAGLIKAILDIKPDVTFVGIGGPKMISLGMESLFPMERLSVMGFVEPLKRLPELLHIRKTIKHYCIENPIDLFIGIDSPDFNLPIERFLKNHSIKTVHYVSPSVWAWRQGRIHKIRESVDLMLTLLPFESEFYRLHKVPECFVGHPLADDIAMKPDTVMAREFFSIPEGRRVVALMPGSRGGEVNLLGKLFLDVACQLDKQLGPSVYLVPAANNARMEQLTDLLKSIDNDLDVRLIDGNSHQVMEASDVILLASGTTALEAMLLKKPMVVAYKMAPFSAFLVKRLLKSPYVSLPNLLANDMLVPEILQESATVDNLAKAVRELLENETSRSHQVDAFFELHESIRRGASLTAARAIMELINAK